MDLQVAGMCLGFSALAVVQARAALKGGGMPVSEALSESGDSHVDKTVSAMGKMHFLYDRPTGRPFYGRFLFWAVAAALWGLCGLAGLIENLSPGKPPA
jgi:hypothetical protein